MQRKYSVDVGYCHYHCCLFFKNGGQCKTIGLFIYLWLSWVFIAVGGLSLVMVNRGYSLVVVCRILIAVDFLVTELRF